MRHGDRGWLIVAAVVVAIEVTADDGELLSEACDRYLADHPWLTRGIVAAFALHLANVLPDRYDPLHMLFAAKRHITPQRGNQ